MIDSAKPMHPTEAPSPSRYFQEGLDARDAGQTLHDNPYAVGSDRRSEWTAGFSATVEVEDEAKLHLDPNDGAERRTSD